MAATITNGNIDTAAAAVPAPFGPLTRVTSVADLPTPNSEITLELTAATGETVYMTYEQLQDADVVQRILSYATGLQYKTQEIIDTIETINTAAQALTAPYTYAEYKALIDDLREIVEVKGFI
jgi:hypothetical protein